MTPFVLVDAQGQDAHHDPVAISVHAQATVADLKQRIFSTSIYGQTVRRLQVPATSVCWVL